MISSERRSPALTEVPAERLRSRYLRLGLLNGAVIGLTLGLAAWLPGIIQLQGTSVPLLIWGVVVGLIVLGLIGAVAGMLAVWFRYAAAAMGVWLVAALLQTVVIGRLPYDGWTWLIWVSDSRFRGLAIYSFGEAARLRMFMAGFFIVVLLTLYGLLQPIRMEGLGSEIDPRSGLTPRGWFLLLIVMIPVAGAGLAAHSIVMKPVLTPLSVVAEVINTGRAYQGDLFELSRNSPYNYNAIAAVRDRMDGPFTLQVGEIEPEAASMTTIVAEFANGNWFNCLVIADKLSHCYDASPPYLQGFPALLLTGSIPEDCPSCIIHVEDDQAQWLAERQGNWGSNLTVARVVQRGSAVVMTAHSKTNNYAIECLLQGISPVKLVSCQEIGSP